MTALKSSYNIELSIVGAMSIASLLPAVSMFEGTTKEFSGDSDGPVLQDPLCVKR
jgi:hypothetical protein